MALSFEQFKQLRSQATQVDQAAQQAGYIRVPGKGYIKNQSYLDPQQSVNLGQDLQQFPVDLQNKQLDTQLKQKELAKQDQTTDPVLSVGDASTLGLPYGTKQSEAAAKGIIPKKANAATAQARKDNLLTALSSLDGAENNLVGAGGARGPAGLLALIPGLGQYLDPAGAAYHATKIELATQLAKAITGGSRPAANVIQGYLHSLPDVQDAPQFAAQKIAKLRSELLTQAKAFNFNEILDAYSSDVSQNAQTNQKANQPNKVGRFTVEVGP